jgi:hypothetical protein
MGRPVTIRVRRAVPLYGAVLLAAIVAWGLYSGSPVAGVLMGTYVGATVAIALTAIFALYVGLGNLDVR